MAIVRVLRAHRGYPCGVYAEVSGAALKEGVSSGAFDEKAEVPDDVEPFELPTEATEDEAPAKPAKKAK
jgi:hypothetical protein